MRGGSSSEMNPSLIQGGFSPVGVVRPDMHLQPSSPQSAWQCNSVMPMRASIENDGRNDSGLVLSLANDGQFNESFMSTSAVQPVATAATATDAYYPQPSSTDTADHDPLTPPDSESMVSPSGNDDDDDDDHDHVLSPCNSSMELSEEVANLAPPAAHTSPAVATTSGALNKSESDDDADSLPDYAKPKINANGKIKPVKCKNCSFFTDTKLKLWNHLEIHIKPEKILHCQYCPFITDLKHHLEFHLRNHKGSRPFNCTKCNYTCVNKSMLISHLKSHSNVYQYRCSDCSYATKYCHSLKLHLRKYKHEPAVVLNPDGTPNPLPVIDVYGTRRGPKSKATNKPTPTVAEPVVPAAPIAPINPPELPPMMGFPFNQFAPPMGFPLQAMNFINPYFLQHLERLVREQNYFDCPPQAPIMPTPPSNPSPPADDQVLDLSKHERTDDYDGTTTTMFDNVEAVVNNDVEQILPANGMKEDDNVTIKIEEMDSEPTEYKCQYCDIKFGEYLLYNIHMGYHGFNDPFACNSCGEVCKDSVSFHLHLARKSHK